MQSIALPEDDEDDEDKEWRLEWDFFIFFMRLERTLTKSSMLEFLLLNSVGVCFLSLFLFAMRPSRSSHLAPISLTELSTTSNLSARVRKSASTAFSHVPDMAGSSDLLGPAHRSS